jgi:hypothetical protein
MIHRTGIPGPDSLSTLSTTTELLQLLLPEEATSIAVEPTPSTDNIPEGEDTKPGIATKAEDAKAEGTGDSTIKQDPEKPTQSEGFEQTVTLKKGELFGLFDVEELKPTPEISVSVAQMKTFLKANSEDEFTLKVLEKRLEVREIELFLPDVYLVLFN